MHCESEAVIFSPTSASAEITSYISRTKLSLGKTRDRCQVRNMISSSSQQFDRSDQAKAYSQFRPDPPKELVEVIISYLEEEVPDPFGLAVDVGCGTGQSTLVLAPHFRSVLGCDVSKSQVREAVLSRKASNVQYRVSAAECLPVGDESVHLLTAGTCFHWLDIPAFFKEAKRVLVPGGVLAIYSSCAIYPVMGDEEKDYQLRILTNKLLYDDLKAYRSPKVQQVFEQYSNVEFPFEDVVRSRNIGHTYVACAADAMGYIKSMSTFQNLRAVYPFRADQLLQDYQDSLMNILNVSTEPESTPLAYRRDYFLILCRKDKRKTK
ncbi:methyltransf_25 domain-containing protein [Nephila pilipes]|uniref:Methyltransf_25 domain-containing protein n=1 Tax=Nephila pilipes TaxID=299642 RepID=A0A8X6PIE4_NEPPI|nr:methyltransf_25 domain-containing protein [Nephila pilipes]